jgi:hypothetical protein
MSAAPQPAPRRRLVAVDADSGEVVNPEVVALTERIASLEAAIHDLEAERRVQRGVITKLKKDKAQERVHYKDREKVEKVHQYWNRRLGHDLALTADRFDAVKGMLEERRIVVVDGKAKKVPSFEYPADFKLAIDGAWYDPFQTPMKNGRVKKHDDLALIFRDGKTMQSFIDRAPVRGGA